VCIFKKQELKKAEKGESPKNNWTVKRPKAKTEMDTKKAKAHEITRPKKPIFFPALLGLAHITD
jgi:hypothetical protein